MNGTYQCGTSTDTLSGRTLSLLMQGWANQGWAVKQTANGYAVTFANGYVRTYTLVG